MTIYNVAARIVTLIDAADEEDAKAKLHKLVDSIGADVLDSIDAFESDEQPVEDGFEICDVCEAFIIPASQATIVTDPMPARVLCPRCHLWSAR